MANNSLFQQRVSAQHLGKQLQFFHVGRGKCPVLTVRFRLAGTNSLIQLYIFYLSSWCIKYTKIGLYLFIQTRRSTHSLRTFQILQEAFQAVHKPVLIRVCWIFFLPGFWNEKQ